MLFFLPFLRLASAYAGEADSFTNDEGHEIVVEHNGDGSVTVQDETTGSDPTTYAPNDTSAAEQDFGLDSGSIQADVPSDSSSDSPDSDAGNDSGDSGSGSGESGGDNDADSGGGDSGGGDDGGGD